MAAAVSSMSHTAERYGHQLERGLKAMVPSDQEPMIDEGKAIMKRYLNLPLSFKMESDICKARNMLKNLKDFPAYVDGTLVSSQIKQAKALCFMTNARAGIFMTGTVGSGLVISQLPDGTWSAPSAVSYVGTGLGLQGGFDLTDYVLILQHQAVESFVGTNQLVLGGDAGLTIGLGRHGTAELHVGPRTSVAFGWAASKGWYMGAAATAGIIHTRKGSNTKFYGREVDPGEILHGKIARPRAARPLYDALNDLP